MRTQPHPIARPSIKMILHIDTPTTALRLPNRPILLKRSGAINRGLVSASGDVDVIGAAVAVGRAFSRTAAAGVVGAEVLNDVVFD
jgi:hypothetical protein